jgi:hypothetical protein
MVSSGRLVEVDLCKYIKKKLTNYTSFIYLKACRINYLWYGLR